jgi:hypothetical protein
MNRLGVLKESHADLKRYARDFLNGAGVYSWSYAYLASLMPEAFGAEVDRVERKAV